MLEVLEDVPNPDIVLVCCGGGGLVSGVAATLSLMGHRNCRVYAIEPEGGIEAICVVMGLLYFFIFILVVAVVVFIYSF